jgi:hypothetical protein
VTRVAVTVAAPGTMAAAAVAVAGLAVKRLNPD